VSVVGGGGTINLEVQNIHSLSYWRRKEMVTRITIYKHEFKKRKLKRCVCVRVRARVCVSE
jgi:hypothetical protein